MDANAVVEGVSRCESVGILIRDEGFFVDDEGQGGGVLGLHEGVAHQLSQFHRSHDWTTLGISFERGGGTDHYYYVFSF